MAKLSGATRRLLLTVIIGGIAVGACFAALLPGAEVLATSHHYTSERLGKLRDLAQRSTIVDAKGNQLAVLGTENRQEVPLSAVPQVLINAVIATEDKTFWENDGVDLNAVFRAAIKNVTSGEIEQGGSTITQQLVKNRILNAKQDINRKIREVVLAFRLNEKYTKKEILEQYLNTVYFGQGSYGVKSATERFFLKAVPNSPFPIGKDLNELTLGEAALLAGLISNPEGNNPFVEPDRALDRRKFVLEQMVDEGYATKAEADAAEKEPLPSIKPTAVARHGLSPWAEEVQDQIIQNPLYVGLGKTPKEREKTILTGGLTIHATKDPDMQNAAEDAVRQGLSSQLGVAATPGFTASLVAIDPNTGYVRAMVAGPGFETSQYNIATSYPGRQMGSTWKVITLAAALEAGFSPNDMIDGRSPCQFGALGTTRNAEAGGRADLRRQTAGSVNCAFARLFLSVGMKKVEEVAHRLGITQTEIDRPERQALTMTLGAIEATPLEMATVAATIAAQGIHHDPLFVDRIEGPDGAVLFDGTKVIGTRAISAEVTACQTDIMQGVFKPGGTASGQGLANRVAAGKTGTTDERKNSAFLGFTPQLAAFVWHGQKDGNVPGAGFGAGVPEHIWKAFMDRALFGQPEQPFPAPGPVCARPGAEVTVFGRVALPLPSPSRSGGGGGNAPVVTNPPQVIVVPQPQPQPQPQPAPPNPESGNTPPSAGGNGNGNTKP